MRHAPREQMPAILTKHTLKKKEEQMLRDAIVVLDFETTGLSPNNGDRITEVAVIRIEGDRITDRYESLVNCGVRIPPFITAYTGITQKMVDGAPQCGNVLRELVRFIGRDPVVAHNASFDHRFFSSECAHTGERNEHDSFICSMRVSRRVYPQFRSHALGSLAQNLGLAYPSSAHRAGADAEVTANLVINIAREIRRRHSRLHVDACVLRHLMSVSIASAAKKLARLAQDAE